MTDTGASTAEAEPTGADHGARFSARSSLRVSIAIAVVIVALDQLSKGWALNALADGAARHVIWTLQWNLSFNRGMAFSTAQGIGPVIGVLALVVVVVMLLSLRQSGSRIAAVAVGFVVGGALGNIADRLFRERGWLHGRVIDFIDFQWFPIFNVADMAINVGGGLLVLTALVGTKAGSHAGAKARS
ncbi:unannotated protein [freshwater metagenome]|uniref:Unannotated protein n=1 Tax=freshwater metagenome TaxID=449393 RepID=A0A6J7F8B5_9ZZZZ|nr:signal peptidase II [Actinomycetota bacterium]